MDKARLEQIFNQPMTEGAAPNSFRPPANWTFAASFPSLQSSLLGDANFINPEFTIDVEGEHPLPANFQESFGYPLRTETAPEGIVRGLSFSASLQLDAAQRLGDLLQHTNYLLSGPVEIVDGIPRLWLKSANDVTLNIAGFELSINLQLVAVWLDASSDGNLLLTPLNFLCVETEIKKDENLKLPLRATFLNFEPHFFYLDAGLESLSRFGFTELASLFERLPLSSFISPNFSFIEKLSVRELSLSVSLLEKNITGFAVTLAYDDRWEILGKPSTVISGLQGRMDVISPFDGDSRSHTLEFFADAEIDGHTIGAYLNLSDLSFQIGLKQDQKIDLTNIIRPILSENIDLPPMNCTELGINGQFQTSNFGITSVMESEWDVLGDRKFIIEQIVFDFAHTSSQPPSTTGFAQGVMTIAGVELDVSAAYDSEPGAGWTFEGSTGPGQAIPIGNLIKDLVSRIGDITLPSAIDSLIIENLKVTFDTAKKNFTFNCESKFRADSEDMDIIVALTIRKIGSGYIQHFSGTIKVGGLDFVLQFVQDEASDYFVAAYHPETPGAPQDVKQLIGSVSAEVAGYVPAGLSIGLKDVFFAYGKGAQSGATSKFLFGLDIGTGISLSSLPLVGQEFTADKTVSVNDLRLLVASKGLTRPEVAALNTLIPTGVTKLPEATPEGKASPSGDNGTPSTDASTAVVIPEGLTVSATMDFAGSTKVLSMPVASGAPAPTTPAQTATDPVGTQAADAAAATTATTTATPSSSSSDNTKWFDLQKTFGPVYFDKVGVQYQEAMLSFLLNAALSAAGLTISLDGLSVGSPLDHFAPEFKLHGIGIDYQNGPVEIGAAFLRTHVTKDGTTYDEYDGTAVIKTAEFTLSALGSYTKLQGHPSLFIYAFLDYPLGGPAFFFVTGLAAGFGYNRKLIVPSIDQVANFPLVQQALGTPGAPTGLIGTLEALHDDIPPAIGEIFLAVGIKFNSFKLIDSFALLTVEFGGRFVVHILGLSNAIIPTPEEGKDVTPLAEIQIAWKATLDPEEGFLGVNAQLTSNSYILSKDCHLTGGYAFYSWFSGEHAGDFVQTLGGYHPSFVVPAHYPVVPRLAFLWQVSGELTIKGDAYYALTGSALMAGGHLEVTFESGDLRAWLKLGADLLISWKPYHYDASIYVDVGVSYTFDVNLLFGHIRITISVDVGADLHLWGPDFSGTADVHLWIISFTISFGAGASQTPEAIGWDTFQKSFLPAVDKVCSVSVKDGLVRTTNEGGERWIINPKHFSLLVNSAVPFKTAQHNGENFTFNDANTSFGIGSMEIVSADLGSNIAVTITRDGVPADMEFHYEPIRKRIPAGLWGESLKPDLNGNTFIENVPTGFELTPAKQPDPGETASIDLSKFKYSSSYFPHGEHYPEEKSDFAYSWELAASFVVSSGSVGDGIATNPQRDSLLKALNVSADVSIRANVANDFLRAPKIGNFSG